MGLAYHDSAMSLPDGSYEDLIRACRIPGTSGFRPHPTNGLHCVRALLRGAFTGAKTTFELGRRTSLIVLAVDGLGYELARACWSPDELVPLTSTFPSTSVVAWLTASTGLEPAGHGLPGVVYRLDGEDALYHAFLNRTVAGLEDPARPVPFAGFTTLFDDVVAVGVDAVVDRGDLASWPSPWADALFRGARELPPFGDWPAARDIPTEIVRLTAGAVAAGIARTTEPRLVWQFVNLDDYMHRHGPDAAIGAALRALEREVLAWTAQGHDVVAFSDHGLTTSVATRATFSQTNAIDDSLCLLPSGGAGRVRWSYPAPGREHEVQHRLEELLGDAAIVVPRNHLATLGLWPAPTARIGAVVALATGSVFPAPMAGLAYDHGSFSADEMFVPFAVWHGD
jgi:hypothetical protein